MKNKAGSILDNPKASTAILVSSIAAVVAVWYLLPKFYTGGFETVSDKGSFGDSFGAVTSLFTGLAFAGLLFTIMLQQREIKLQREDFLTQLDEMRLARQESARLAAIQEKQLALGMAELKMKPLEVKIAHINMKSLQWVEGARGERTGPELLKVKAEMDAIIEELETKNKKVEEA